MPLSETVGGEGRSGGFDPGFAPLQEHRPSRRVSVAVARALGRGFIEAEVI